ncbi:MAG: DUF2298 domain-containing protein [Thermomicrobiales bacterium]|nr:DUF2298 domain-containing protein [Thermomicrobiales bacterium]
MIRRIGFAPLLIIIVGMALTLRVLGLNWDLGTHLHPDERFMVWVTTDMKWPGSIGAYFNTAISPLNPYNTNRDSFVYGTFPSFLVKAIAGVFDKDVYGELHLVGRAVSAFFDTGTVVLTALIGRRFWSERVGLLAALFLAFTPLMLQTAYYFTVDSFATFFVVAAFWFAVRSWDRHSIAWMAVAGVMVGLAGASKPNALLCIVFLALPALELVRTSGWRALIPTVRDRVYPAVAAGVVGGLFAFSTFRIAQPYAFVGPHWWSVGLNQQWLDDLAFWRTVQTGLVDMKPSVQWFDRTPVLYIMQNLVLWGMGVALGISAMAGLGVLVWRLLHSTTWPDWFMLGMAGWSIGNIVLYGTGIAQNQRYLMQIYPFLAVFAAAALIEVADRWRRWHLGRILLGMVTLYTIVYGLAFTSIFVRPITRIEATEWIFENVPAGSMISNEYWDDPLPLPLAGYDRGLYPTMTLDLYGDESADNSKVTTLVGQLAQIDYVVLSSNRIIDSVARQPERYPVANRFYEMLLSGELGFEPVQEFTRGPAIFGLEWNDLSAEESLLVYDHPQVRIFKKTDSFSAQHVYDELNVAWGSGGLHYIPGDPAPDQMLLSDTDIATSVQHGSWSDQFGSGVIQRYPLVFWWLAIQAIGLVSWPLTWRLFGHLPDAGAMLAKAVGLLATVAITLTLVSYTSALFTRSTILVALLILGLVSAGCTRRHTSRFIGDIRTRWQVFLIGEAFFTLAFTLIAMMRGWQRIAPDAELAQFTSVMRSSSLPPLDLWFSGGILHTYWVALLPWVSVGRLLGIEPVAAFGLTIATVVALTAALVGSTVSLLTRSRLALLAPIIVVAASGTGFTEGLAPQWLQGDVPLSMLAMLPLIAMLLLTLIGRRDHLRWPLLATALALGAIVAGAEWGIIVGACLLFVGLMLPALQERIDTDPWWPVVRRLVCEGVAVAALGVAIWYPAISAHTATYRNLVTPHLWTVDSLVTTIGMMVFLALLIMTFGASQALAETLHEGWVGMLTAAIAAGVVMALLIVAIVADSALLIVMALSLVAVLALWHWLRDVVMQWSISLVLLGVALLVYAQVRPAHADINGVISTEQMIPVVWMLLVVAVLTGAISLAHLVPTAQRRYAATGMALVMALVVAPTLSALRDSVAAVDWSPSGDPAISASVTELEAATWLQEQPGMPVILSLPDAHVPLVTISGQPSVLASSNFAYRTRPGWDRLVERRRTDISTIYASLSDWDTIAPLLDRYRIDYIVVGTPERIQFGVDLDVSAVTDGYLEIAWQGSDLIIYRVIRP